MKPPPLRTICPLCDSAFDAPAADLRGAEIAPGREEVERVAVECPVCAWEYTADGEGRAVDNELDREGPFEIAPDGGPDAEGLLNVTCPHCGAAHQTGEPGVTRCPRCRRLLPVEPEGEAAPEEEEPWDWEPDYEDGLEDEEAPACPNCGMGFYEEPEYGARGFRPLEGGWVQCPDCDWVFHPPPFPEEWLAAEGTPPPAPGFEGRDGDEDVAVYTVAADGSGDFTTLGQALAAAPWRGASVRARPGRYEERLVLRRTVELRADGPPGSVCLHSGEGPCLRIGCDTVTVRGLRLESAEVAVEVSDGRPLLEDCSLHGGRSCAAASSRAGRWAPWWTTSAW